MSEIDFPYKTTFSTKANLFKPSNEIVKETKASLLDLKGIFPLDIDPETDPDILYIVANLAVAGVLNLNDDGVSISETISIYKKFEKKQANLEHDRKQIVGYIVKAGLSELGTNRPISEEEAQTANKPFNISVVIAVWKVAAKDLCEFISEKEGPEGNLDLSLSFEVGFDKYQIIELSNESINFSDAKKIIFDTSPEFTAYDIALKINGGSGKKNGNKIGRVLCGKVLPLGAGIVTQPAANVKGLVTVTEKISNKTQENLEANNFAPPTNQPFVAPAKMKKIKLSESTKKELEKYASIMSSKTMSVQLKSGKKIKLANYNNGYLEVPDDEDFTESDVMSFDTMEVADQTHVDNSEIIHPRINKIFPNVNQETQKKNEEFEKQKEELRKKDYKDASGMLVRFVDLIQRMNQTAKIHFEKIHLKNGVLKTTTNNNMKLEEIKAKVASNEDPSNLKECVANALLFAEEIAKKSEEMEAANANHHKVMEDALKAKKEAEDMHKSVKDEMEALKHKLEEMEAGQHAAESERKFNARMGKLEADYDMDDASRSHVAKDIQAMSDEDYASYEMKLGAFMKEKSKTYKNQLSEKLKAALKEEEAKKKETEAGKKIEIDPSIALASARENIVDAPIDNVSIETAKTMKEKMKEAFGTDVKVGGQTIKELNEIKAKSLTS